VVICLERGANLHMAQLMPLPLTVSCFSEIQIGFTFLVLAHLGSPGKMAVKWVCALLELGEGYQNGASINKAIKIIYTFLPSFWVLANRVYMKIVVKMKARRFRLSSSACSHLWGKWQIRWFRYSFYHVINSVKAVKMKQTSKWMRAEHTVYNM